MEQSVLDKISPFSNVDCYFDGWRNGKIGAITDVEGNCIYRFIETVRNENGDIVVVNKSKENYPIVAVGITAYWIVNRKNFNPLMTKLGGGAKREHKSVREMFDAYTEERYNRFKDYYKDNPDTWDWDWDYRFYAEHIIPNELRLNRQAEALFDYISDTDIELVRSLMNNYIKYLKTIRQEKGYHASPDYLVLRSIAYSDESMLEDLEVYEVNETLDKLEKEGYVRVAWIEGHTPEAIRLLDKGKVYLKQLEERCRTKATSPDAPNVSRVNAKNKKKKNSSKTTATFVYNGYGDDPFQEQRLELIASHLLGQFVLGRKTSKSTIKDFFTGKEIADNTKIFWKGTKSELVYFFRELNLRGYIKHSNHEKLWVIVASHIKIKKELKKCNLKDVPISADSLQTYSCKPKKEMMRKLDKIIKFFEPDIKMTLEQAEIDTETEAEDARYQELANRDFVRSQKK